MGYYLNICGLLSEHMWAIITYVGYYHGPFSSRDLLLKTCAPRMVNRVLLLVPSLINFKLNPTNCTLVKVHRLWTMKTPKD